MNKRTQYTALGFAVSKLVLPIIRKQAKKKARSAVVNAADGGRRAVHAHPARTAVAVGAVVGAVGWMLSRTRGWGVRDERDA